MRSVLLIVGAGFGLAIITFGFSYIGNWQWNNNIFYSAGFLVLLTLVVDQINIIALRQRGRAVITPYLFSTVLKLLLSIVFLIVIVKQNPTAVKELVITFLIYYAVFSTLEIFLVRQRTKK